MLNQANLYAYEFAMITVGVAGLILCTAFYRTGLIPRPLAVWGLVGYLVILAGSVLQVLGFDLQLDPGHPRRPVGRLHRRLVDRQGIQHPNGSPPPHQLDDHHLAFDGELHALTSDAPGGYVHESISLS